MKGKFLFAAAFAALATSCSQEEIVETPMNTVDGRIAIESPQIATGKSVDTRMTTDGEGYTVKWEEGDGFGAMLVDQVKNLSAEKFDDRYEITPDNKATNYMFRYDAVNETFNTYAAMVEGNYVFYAPFNENENTRKSLLIRTPLVQTVTPGVYNSAVAEFYKRADHPVFIAYKTLEAANPEKKIKVGMRHIFALPKITLDNQYYTEKTVGGKKENVYHDLTVYKVEFINIGSNFMSEANIDNGKVISAVTSEQWNGKMHEKAATSDLYSTVGKTNDVITVNFKDGGVKIAQKSKKDFAVVLPAENYGDNLKVRVYVKVDNSNEEMKFETALKSAQPLRLNPGFPYPAQEYNADGSLKESKGTSATYTLAGNLVPASTPEVKATGIESEKELIDYINDVAYRGKDITQVANAEDVTNVGLQFNIKDGATITLTDNFLDAVKNSLLVNTEGTTVNGTLTFISNSQLRLGKITEDRTLEGHIIYGTDALKVAGNYKVQNGDNITVTSGTVTVPADIQYTITNNGGTINVEGKAKAGSTIANGANGTININGDVDANLTINNTGADKKPATINIVAGKTVKSVIINSQYGVINNAGYLYSAEDYTVTNNGLINVTDANAGIKFAGVGGKICNNVQCEFVTVTGGATIYCDLTAVKAVVSNINTVNLSGNIAFKANTFTTDLTSVKTVNVADGTVITSPNMTGDNTVTFKFNGSKSQWKSNHPMNAITITGFLKEGNVIMDAASVTWVE